MPWGLRHPHPLKLKELLSRSDPKDKMEMPSFVVLFFCRKRLTFRERFKKPTLLLSHLVTFISPECLRLSLHGWASVGFPAEAHRVLAPNKWPKFVTAKHIDLHLPPLDKDLSQSGFLATKNPWKTHGQHTVTQKWRSSGKWKSKVRKVTKFNLQKFGWYFN